MSPHDHFVQSIGEKRFATVLADPPWRFHNKTGKVAPEHKRLSRYPTMSFEEIEELPVGSVVADTAHLYLWIPNALLPHGLRVMRRWGFEYKTNRNTYSNHSGSTPVATNQLELLR